MRISGCLSRAFSMCTALPRAAHPCPKSIFGLSFDTTRWAAQLLQKSPATCCCPPLPFYLVCNTSRGFLVNSTFTSLSQRWRCNGPEQNLRAIMSKAMENHRRRIRNEFFSWAGNKPRSLQGSPHMALCTVGQGWSCVRTELFLLVLGTLLNRQQVCRPETLLRFFPFFLLAEWSLCPENCSCYLGVSGTLFLHCCK